jgi:hypothetical protein
MSKLVDKARLAKLAQALDARAKAAVQAEADRAMAAEEALQGAIDAINHAETGILKQAKDYADAAVQTEKEAREEAEELLDGRIGDLEEVIFGGEGAEDGIDKMKSDIQANAEAIAKLNGGAEEEGSVAKAVADGVKPVQDAVDAAEVVLVFSCGVGVQTIAEYLGDKPVYAACDTYPLPGFQGVTPLEYDCKQCGECYLNITGGICPITACSKSLVNGQCGGSKNGKCEVDSCMECGWERIHRRLAQLGRLDVLKCPVQVRNYATDDEVK